MIGFKDSLFACKSWILLFTGLFLSINVIPNESDSYSNAEASHQEDHSGHSYQHAKRLFHGLSKTESGDLINCAACHNVYYIDTLNWNPSALDIARSTAKLDSAQFSNLILNPVTKRLSETHANFKLTGEEIQLIRGYLGKIEKAGVEKRKPNVTRFLLFIFMFLIFGWAITDLIIIKKVEKKYILTIILLVTSVGMTKILVEDAIKVGRSQDYAPLQPIKFSHKVHALENQIDCQYCHHTAENSKSAGIPSANLCLNCHSLVREGTNSGRFEINKIHTAIDSSHPIEWVRIHRLPDFVYFSHAQHVGAGKLDCRECHGKVEEMDVLKQQNDLSMGWCLDCHRTRSVNFLENDYYGMTFKDYHDKIISGEMDSVTVADIGGENCMKCHY